MSVPAVSAYVYLLRCVDGSYYVGTTRHDLEKRIGEHEAGSYDGYTARRRPVNLVFHEAFEHIDDAVAAERQIKGWRREEKEALIWGDYTALPSLARRGSLTEDTAAASASFETRPDGRSSG